VSREDNWLSMCSAHDPVNEHDLLPTVRLLQRTFTDRQLASVCLLTKLLGQMTEGRPLPRAPDVTHARHALDGQLAKDGQHEVLQQPVAEN